jgi:hypothetical protein
VVEEKKKSGKLLLDYNFLVKKKSSEDRRKE